MSFFKIGSFKYKETFLEKSLFVTKSTLISNSFINLIKFTNEINLLLKIWKIVKSGFDCIKLIIAFAQKSTGANSVECFLKPFWITPSLTIAFILFTKAFSFALIWNFPSIYLLEILPILKIVAFNLLFETSSKIIFSASNFVCKYVLFKFWFLYKSFSPKYIIFFSCFKLFSGSPSPETLVVEIW